MDVMHCRDSKSKNYGMAGTLSVYLFIVSAILCFIVYRMTTVSYTHLTLPTKLEERKRRRLNNETKT